MPYSPPPYMGGGGGGGAVDSVNGQTGVVSLTASSVGAKSADWVPAWSDVTSKPATFPPSAHTHAISAVTGLSSALTAKADLVNGLIPVGQLPPGGVSGVVLVDPGQDPPNPSTTDVLYLRLVSA